MKKQEIISVNYHILKNIKSLSDGFKISKIEIAEFNLMNNVYFVKEE